MLEQAYWIAGIVVAVVAVVGLLRWRKGPSTNIDQNAKVSGQGNTVNQRVGSQNGEGSSDQ